MNTFIPIQAAPGLRFFKRLFLGPGSLPSAAYRQDILCPAEEGTNRSAIFLPGQLDRVTASLPDSTRAAEIYAATALEATHAATIAYHVKGAVLIDGSLYMGSHRHMVADKSLFTSATREPRHLKVAALASSYVGTRWFGHWLWDDCIQYLLAQQISQPLSVRRATSLLTHAPKYQAYFGQDWTPTDRARIDHLVVFQDFGQNSLKRKRYCILRDRMKVRFPATRRGLLVYLRRGQTGESRLVQNEDEILDALLKQGFVVIDVATDSLEHIVRTIVDARILVSMEGSHVAHATYAIPETSGLLVLQPPDRFTAVGRGWAECLGVRFGFVVGSRRNTGYYFSPAEILHTADLLLRSLEE